MKTSNQIMEQLMLLIAADTTVGLEELRVYMVWSTDKASFSACASEINKRLPHMSIKNVYRALKKLETKGYIKADGFGHTSDGKRFKKYTLSVSPQTTANYSPETTSKHSKRSGERGIPSKGYLLTTPTNKIPQQAAGKQEVVSTSKEEKDSFDLLMEQPWSE